MKEWKLFSPQGKIYKALETISDFCIWNLLWIVCSIPLITIGAATCALYDMNLKYIRKEPSRFVDFFKAFNDNFWFGIGWEAMVIAVTVLYLGGIRSIEKIQLPVIFVVIFYAVGLLGVAVGSYMLPTRVCFVGTWRDILKLSIYFCLKMPFYFLGKILILLLPGVLGLFFYDFYMTGLLPIVFLFGVSVSNWLNQFLYMKIIAKQGYEKDS